MEKQKCNYPGCKKEGCYMQPFTIINEDNASVELLFCEYHHLIVMGGHFKAKIIKGEQNLLGEKKDYNFELIGPLHEVEIAEQVFASIEMIRNGKEKTKKTLE